MPFSFFIFEFPLKNCLNLGLDAFFRKPLCQHKNWFFQKLANQCWTVYLIEAFLESLIHVLCSNQIFYDYGLFMELAMKFYLRSCLRILSFLSLVHSYPRQWPIVKSHSLRLIQQSLKLIVRESLVTVDAVSHFPFEFIAFLLCKCLNAIGTNILLHFEAENDLMHW